MNVTRQLAPAQIALITLAAMIAFAANSVLCRMALGANQIDPASFSSIRVISGAACLLLIISLGSNKWRPSRPNWLSVIALYIYMICFSIAYLSLSAGTGALLLFGCVQLTMIGTALYRGERLAVLAWIGLALACVGLIYLVYPGIESPHLGYSALMAIAGLAWGIYSLMGMGSKDPTSSTANNFLYATPLAIVVNLLLIEQMHLTTMGVILGILSGALASGVGYAIWYTALTYIKTTTAAIAQLSVPAIATMGGALLLAEPFTFRMIIATCLTLGGIALFLSQTKKNG